MLIDKVHSYVKYSTNHGINGFCLIPITSDSSKIHLSNDATISKQHISCHCMESLLINQILNQ